MVSGTLRADSLFQRRSLMSSKVLDIGAMYNDSPSNRSIMFHIDANSLVSVPYVVDNSGETSPDTLRITAGRSPDDVWRTAGEHPPRGEERRREKRRVSRRGDLTVRCLIGYDFRGMAASPTARTLALLRREGWSQSQVVETWNPHARRRVDLLGWMDIMGIFLPSIDSHVEDAGERAADPEGSRPSTTETLSDGKPEPLPGTLAHTFNLGSCIVGLQVTTASGGAARRAKMAPLVGPFLMAGGVVLLLLWRKKGSRWQWAAERFTITDGEATAGPRTAWMTPPRMAGG